ncbi:hypothetical protein ACFQVC_01250 [Streptomyces monticola]|uniref:DUF4272 domain-containing protein n=1 Tax=Streptomyces monticola TaxID=2666263 RepID=A0ABW2JBD8_9ACTN
MIVIADARAAELYEAWSRVRADTDPASAEPLIQDCVRRLAADPGGEAAHVWVAGLVEMAGYLAWRPREETRRAAVAALLDAAAALDSGDCGHERHPYEEELGTLDEFEECLPGGAYLLGDTAERPRQEADLCPRNVAGTARVTADVVAPFCAPGIPAVVPEEHTSEVDSLLDFLHDYPSMEPGPTIESNAWGLPDRPSRGALAGFILTQHVSCWYVIYRITERPVFDAMIEGLEQAAALLGDTQSCPHTDGGHPGPEGRSYETDAELAFQLRSPGGRARAREGLGDEGPMEAWVCPRFLRELADEALGELHTAYTSLFGVRDTSGLDALYVRPEGGLDIGKLTQTVADGDGDVAEQNAGLWAARRHADAVDPHERLVLLHLAMWCAASLDLPYGPGREVRELLRSVDQEPLDRECPHGTDGHPDADLRESWNTREFKAHLDHLYAPGEFTAPRGAYPAEVWACPRLLAAWAQGPVIEMDEAYQDMDQEDGDEHSTLL